MGLISPGGENLLDFLELRQVVSTFKPRIDSHYGATWDSPVGKPRGKATDPLIHVKGSVTLLLQLGRKAHVPTPTRDED